MATNAKAAGRRTAIALFLLPFVATCTLAVWGIINWQYPRSDPLGAKSDAAESARLYIVRRPMDPAGWLARAEARYAIGRDASASVLVDAIAIAAMLAPVDPQVLRARMSLALLRGEVVTGLTFAAETAALFPTESREAFSTLRAYANDPAWLPFLEKQLAGGWRAAEPFLLESCQSGAPLGTLLSIAKSVIRRQPLSETTVTCIGKKAIADGQIRAAYWLWLNALAVVPTPIGNVFNGDFERPLSGRLFDWQLNAGGDYREGFAASVRLDDSRGKRNNILVIRFNGRTLRPPVAQQFLALAPGQYLFSYSARELALSAPDSISWTVRCIPATMPATLSEPVVQPISGGWIRKQQNLVIPSGCDGQLLDLELGNRLQLAQGLNGSVLFDDVNIVRK